VSARISNIVFTKDRPLQLEAYLDSLYRQFPSGEIQTFVLYKRHRFDAEYRQVFAKHAAAVIVEEKDFHQDFLGILDPIHTPLLLFGVDDVVYYDSVDLEVVERSFSERPGSLFGFSLRMDPDEVATGGDPLIPRTVGDQRVFAIDWRHGMTPTTRYPFELGATVYQTELVKQILGRLVNGNVLLKGLFSPGRPLIRAWRRWASPSGLLRRLGYFYDPNTLEDWCHRWCRRHAQELPPLLGLQRRCASAIQVNMVNTSIVNEVDGGAEHSVDTLAQRYREGLRLDIDYVIRHKPSGTHTGQDHFRLVSKSV
jgi:hypothetical protein